ncbi:MAG: hypothetical protein MJY75_06985, partial [Bacteroidaceae bacterium]|nr:hypothetical protein [Bacteroidaceae bacterium]
MDYIDLKDRCVKWIQDWFQSNGPQCSAVIGMSGGKDSTVAAALCAEALGKDRVVGVSIPSNGQSLNEADEICRYLGIRYVNMHIGDVENAFRALGDGLKGLGTDGFTSQTILNIPPRIR